MLREPKESFAVFWCTVFVMAAAMLMLMALGAFGQECDPSKPGSCGDGCVHPAVARIRNQTSEWTESGSGTLIEHDGQPMILTCGHLFRDGVGTITYGFDGVHRGKATLLKVDQVWDLAVLIISRPAGLPVAIAEDYPKPGDTVRGFGWGKDCSYRSTTGRVLGYVKTTKTPTAETLEFAGATRDGDSGGPMLNTQGELVGVIWGTDNRSVMGTSCGRIRQFLRGIVRPLVPIDRGKGRQVPAAESPQEDVGGSLRNPLEDIIDQPVVDPPEYEAGWVDGDGNAVELPPQPPPLDRQDLTEIFTELSALRQAAGVATLSPSLVDAAVPALLAGLGWTGPPAVAVIMGLKVASVLIRRRRRRKRSGGVAAEMAPEFPGESIGSIPRDDTEAAQFLQLSKIEGRSPLLDALVGRIAFDELDRFIDSKPDGPQADWARALKRTYEDRFNEMAPPALFAAGQTS